MTAGQASDPGVKGPAWVKIRRRVEWPDTDAAGRYHHSTVIRWVEAAEAELFAALQLLEVFGSVPRVHYEVDYKSPVYFRDEIELALVVDKVGGSSVRYTFKVLRLPVPAEPGRVVAQGALVAVIIDADSGSPRAWPEDARQRLLTSGEQGSAPGP